MKRVEVIVPPAKLDEVKDALVELGVPGMTVSTARVFGRASRRREVYRGSSYVVDFAFKTKIEMVVRDDVVPGILEVLERSSGIGPADDSSVLISDIVKAIRIRTGEQGEEAIDPPAYFHSGADVGAVPGEAEAHPAGLYLAAAANRLARSSTWRASTIESTRTSATNLSRSAPTSMSSQRPGKT